MAALRVSVRGRGARDAKQPHVERFQLLVENLQLGDTRPGLSQLVSDQVSEAVALGADVGLRTGQQLTDLLQGEAESLSTLDELEPANCLPSVDPVAGLGSGRRPQQPPPPRSSEELKWRSQPAWPAPRFASLFPPYLG